MSAWLYRLAVCGIVCAVAAAAAPGELRKHAAAAGSLLFLILMLSPIRDLSGFDAKALLDGFEARAEASWDRSVSAEIRSSELSGYLTEAAAQSGLSCRIEVRLDETAEGISVLWASVEYDSGTPSEEEKALAEEIIREVTGLSPEKIEHRQKER